MRWLKLALPLLGLGLALPARTAQAHGFGERTELPVPLEFFIFGAGAVVVLSFALIGGVVRRVPPGVSYPRYNLLRSRWTSLILTSPLLLLPLKLLSVFLLGLVVAAGLVGDQTPTGNFAPTFVWITWWVGMAFFVSLVGNLWALANPWKIIFEAAEALYRRLRPGSSLSLGLNYPRAWGIWPGLVLFACFVWVQDAFPQSELPDRVAFLALAYTVLTLGGMALFGKHRWLRHGEAFSVVFGFMARFSPTEVRVVEPDLCRSCDGDCPDRDGECIDCYQCFEAAGARELNVRPPAVGLSRNELVTNDKLVMVVLLLAVVIFDGFSATSAWVDFQSIVAGGFSGLVDYAAFNSITVADTVGLLLFPAVFLLVYLTFTFFMSGAVSGARGGWALARAFALSLLPIALAYNITHFITLLLIQGQLLVPLASDPFGYGWDLFGTRGYEIAPGIISAGTLWFLSVALIVVGHVLAVYLAHLVSVRTFGDRSVARGSQYPMLMLMVVYTIVSLWIIAQPIVA